MKPKILIALNTAWNLHNFRAGLIRGLIEEGFDVVAVAPSDNYGSGLNDLGCRYIPLPMDNHGMHPGRDFRLFIGYVRILRKERPAVFLGYTIKPNIYGSLAAHLLGIPVINNISGLGRAFSESGWLSFLAGRLYRLSLSFSSKVFFQNEEDRGEFIARRLVNPDKTDRLPGSGIDLKKFQFEAQSPSPSGNFRFLLHARMLWEKGVGVYVDAARILKRNFPDVECSLLGFLDGNEAGAISTDQIALWVDEGVVRYLGHSDDVRSELRNADCVVLPSYYKEGVPKSLLEAAAMGCPIITTDTTGCREVVDDGLNGFLCRPQDSQHLAGRMMAMLALSPDDRRAMGTAGRQKVEMVFDEDIEIKKYIESIRSMVKNIY